MTHARIAELYADTKDPSLLRLTPFELRECPALTGNSLADLATSRVFRAGNPLLDKLTKKMQLEFPGSDSRCFKFGRVPADVTQVDLLGVTLGDSSDILIDAEVHYYFNGGKDWRESTGFVVSDVSGGNAQGSGMGVNEEFEHMFAGRRGIYRLSSQNYSGEVLSKPRPHNDEVVCLRDKHSRPGKPIDLVLANHERNLVYRSGQAPVPAENVGVYELRDRGTVHKQWPHAPRHATIRHPFKQVTCNRGFDRERFDFLLENSGKRYERVLPAEVVALRGKREELYRKFSEWRLDCDLAVAFVHTLDLMD